MLGNKTGQVGVYVLVALVIIGGIVGIVLLTNSGPGGNESNFAEVYQYYDSCIQTSVKEAIQLAGTQGGRVYNPEFIPGSEYAPFASQLNFFGFGVPYWYYISGNGLQKEQVPSKSQVISDFQKYINQNVAKCDFSVFEDGGYNINLGDVSSKVTLSSGSIDVVVNSGLKVEKNGTSSSISSRTLSIKSSFSDLFDEALRIYGLEKNSAFLENYTVDVLRLYAPVDGVLLQCNPEVWSTQKVKNDLGKALEANLGALKFKAKVGADYFATGFASKFESRVLYSSAWPQSFDVYGDGAGDGALVANPMGVQEGMAAMGFCYVPYHFVYDMKYPALIQLFSGDELFQFPMIVVVDKNLPRKGIYDSYFVQGLTDNNADLCFAKTSNIQVGVVDVHLNPVDADISFQCFDQECSIGKTSGGLLDGMFPACSNGYVVAKAKGYADKKVQFSSDNESSLNVIMDRLYSVNVSMIVDGKAFSGGSVMVSFAGENGATAVIPGNREIKLSEGNYNITAYVYSNSSITLPATKSNQCVEVAKGGLMSFFGGTEEKCFDVSIPETKITSALRAGGKTSAYLLESDLSTGKIIVESKSLPEPKTLTDLQTNFELFDSNNLDVHS